MPSSDPQLVLNNKSTGWNAGFNPVVYEVLSLKYPVNNYHDVHSVVSGDVSNDSGFVKITFVSTPAEFKRKLSVRITGSTSYDGVYRILDRQGTYIIIDLTYTTAQALDVRYSLTGYYLKADVYVGLVGHPLNDEQPYVMAGSHKIVPELYDDGTYEGRALIDISDLMRKYLVPFNHEESDYYNPTIKNLIHEWSMIDDTGAGDSIKVTEYYDDIDGDGNVITTAGVNITPTGSDPIWITNSANQLRNPNAGGMDVFVPNITGNPLSRFLTDAEMWAQFRGQPFSFRHIISKDIFTNAAPCANIDIIITEYDEGTFNQVGSNFEGNLAYLRFRFSPDCPTPTEFRIFNPLDIMGTTYPITVYGTDISGNTIYQVVNVATSYPTADPSIAPGITGVLASIDLTTNAGVFQFNLRLNVAGMDVHYVYDPDTPNTVEYCASSGLDIKLRVQTKTINREIFDTTYSEVPLNTGEGVFLLTDENVTDSNYPSNVAFISYALVNSFTSISELDGCLFGEDHGDILLSETMTAMLFPEQCRAKTFLWLTPSGGWEMFTFTGKHEYGYDIIDDAQMENDIEGNYPVDFINQKTQIGFVSKKSVDTTTVRSQPIPFEIYKWVSLIQRSPQVYIAEDGLLKTVVIDQKSVDRYKEGDKTFVMEFQYTATNPIISQRP